MVRIAPYVVLGVLCSVLFFWRLGSTPLLGLDEGLYAECAREMLSSGNYVVPCYNGEPFLDKPPLCYWLQALAMRVFGVSSFSARLPSAVAALVLVGFTVFAGTKLYGRRAGLMAGFALATSMLGMGLARLCSLDEVFALTIAVALGAFILSWARVVPRWGYLAFWAAAGLSVMAKGPAGAVLVFGTAAAFIVARRRWRELGGMMPAAGVLVFAAVVLPWYALVQIETGGAFLSEFILHQNVQRALGVDFQHNMPFYFYAPIYLVGFFPWSVFVPLAFVRHTRFRPKDTAGEASLFFAIWTVAVVLVFSLSRSKLPSYIMPAFPASALLVGLMWSKAQGATLRRWTAVALVVAVVIGLGMQVGLRFLRTPIPGLSLPLAVMGLSMVAGTTLALILACRKRSVGAFAALCGGTAGFLLAAAWLGLPVATQVLSGPVVGMAREIEDSSSPGERVIAYRLSPPQPSLAFYTDRPVCARSSRAELEEELASNGAARC